MTSVLFALTSALLVLNYVLNNFGVSRWQLLQIPGEGFLSVFSSTETTRSGVNFTDFSTTWPQSSRLACVLLCVFVCMASMLLDSIVCLFWLLLILCVCMCLPFCNAERDVCSTSVQCACYLIDHQRILNTGLRVAHIIINHLNSCTLLIQTARRGGLIWIRTMF